MRISASPSPVLTYCTNVHPAETLDEVGAVLRRSVREVKAAVCAEQPFGVGLRLSALAARELEAPSALPRFRAELDEAGLFVFTINGFPYGQFHGTRIKEAVYRPDWLEPARVDYTRSLARVLALLLPDGFLGSISSVPGSFAARGASPEARRVMAANVARAAAELVRLEAETGKELCLALEPEPACMLETTAQAVEFFERELFSAEIRELFAALVRTTSSRAEALLRRHVGLCLDTCHASVQFEPPLEALRGFAAAGIRVPKVQVSAGLSVQRPSRDALHALSAFADDTYLHQVVVRSDAGLRRFVDLPEALERAAELPPDAEWRIHFHVPVFLAELGPFASTQAELVELLSAPETRALVPHLEVETYTFDVLPERYKATGVVPAIARELKWTLDQLRAPAGGTRRE